jgi:intracellular multiplication protein IcmO
VNIDNAKLSNTYNPLLRGDSEQIVNRVMLLIGSGKGDAFFRSQAANGIRAIVGLLKVMNLAFSFEDLQVIMSNEGALRYLLNNGPKDTREYADFQKFVDQITEVNFRTGQREISEKKRQFSFGDLLGKISAYATGDNVRDVVNAYNPEVDVLKAMLENQLVYIGLPMLSKGEAAADFAKILMSDIMTAVGQLQNTAPTDRPNPTFLILMDEFSSYALPTMAPLFEQARSANICLFPFIQTYSSLSDAGRGLSKDFANKIFGNTWNKISFKLEDAESREEMSRIAGEMQKAQVSESISDNISFASGNEDASMLLTTGRGRGTSRSVSYAYDAIARPEDFRALVPGEAIFIGKNGVYKLKIPEVVLKQDSEGLDFPRFKMPAKRGLALADKYHTFTAGPATK